MPFPFFNKYGNIRIKMISWEFYKYLKASQTLEIASLICPDRQKICLSFKYALKIFVNCYSKISSNCYLADTKSVNKGIIKHNLKY